MINLPYMGLITIRLMNAPTNHVPANPRHVHTPISDDEQPALLVIYAGSYGGGGSPCGLLRGCARTVCDVHLCVQYVRVYVYLLACVCAQHEVY